MRLFNVLKNKRMSPDTMGPVKHYLNHAKGTLRNMPDEKQWLCGGFRSAAIAADMLSNGKIIALPTDTVYGLAGLAQNNKSIAKLYEIKKRDEKKPLAICLWHNDDIQNWADIKDLPEGLITALLPGPTTLVLKRKDTVNPNLNPGVTNVGVRVPKSEFIRSVIKMVNQPIALTSANESNKPSTLHPKEFEDLWPTLDGIFYERMSLGNYLESWRNGSTVVDLSIKGEYHILRKGIGFHTTTRILKQFNLKRKLQEKANIQDESEESNKEDDNECSKKVKACA